MRLDRYWTDTMSLTDTARLDQYYGSGLSLLEITWSHLPRANTRFGQVLALHQAYYFSLLSQLGFLP